MREAVMSHFIEEQRFNDDLLLCEEDRRHAERRFLPLFHVLDVPMLREFFSDIDEQAKRAKLRSQLIGILAVVLAVVGLWGASADRFYQQYDPHLALGFAICSVLGVLIGLGGVLLWPSKKRWLYLRMLGERTRQFYFQVFVCRPAEILASLADDDGRERFRLLHQDWFAEFDARFRHHAAAELTELLEDVDDTSVWLHRKPEELGDALLESLPNEFFDSYRSLRIRAQIQYADYKLRHSQGVFAPFSPSQLKRFLGGAGMLMTILVVVIELVIGIGIAAHVWNDAGSGDAPGPMTCLHVGAIWSAILALGLRTLEEGLQPKRELERYQRYHAEVEDILNRFDEAHSAREKYDVMVEMERLSFVEMRDFLLTNHEARFVM